MILFPPKWSEAPVPEYRVSLLDSPSVICPVAVKEAMRHVAKTPDCVRQLKDASAAWEVNAGRYLFVFCKVRNEDHLQKVTVWAKKQSGVFIRLKTVWIANEDYIFEAIPYFLAEYFDMDWSIGGMISDVEFFHWLDMVLKDLARDCPAGLKKKEKIIKDWSAFMPKFLDMLKELDKKVAQKANPRPSPSQVDAKQKSIDDLLAENCPIDFAEFRDAVCHSEYSDEIFGRADNILLDLEGGKEEDMELTEAAVRYDSMMGVQDCLKGRNTRFNRRKRLVGRANRLLRCWKSGVPSEPEMRGINALTPLHCFFSAMNDEKDAKLTAKNLRVLAQCIQTRAIPNGFEMLDALANAREVCRRLPQELSTFMKNVFEYELSSNSYWTEIVDESSLYDRLRRLSIQSRALDLMKYDVARSYPRVGMQKERGEIFFAKDSRCHVVFSRMLRDYDLQFATADYVERYHKKLTEYAAGATSPVDILNYAAAILCLCQKQKIDVFTPPTSRELPAISSDNTAAATSGQESETNFLHSCPKEWAEKAARCAERMFMEGGDVESYCEENNLPFAEFNHYYEILMDRLHDVGVAHQNELKSDLEYRQKEIEQCRKRQAELYEEMREANEKLQKIFKELDIVKKYLSDLESM